MNTHFPDNILSALKDALVNVFWKKKDLRELFRRCDVPSLLYATQDWEGYKFHIIDPVLDALNTSPEGLGPLRRILAETLTYRDGEHLLYLPDGQKRKREAERCLDHLRLLVEKHDARLESEREEQERRRREAEQRTARGSFYQRLSGLRDCFLSLYPQLTAQGRGYGLEKLLYDLLDLFELAPRGPFRITGEQIDGAFVLDGDHYLLEAKWQTNPVNLETLRDLDAAVASNLDNTLGLFVSINGFSVEGLQRYRQGSRPRVLCMDGMDLTYVLEGQIDLSELLRRKRTIAAQRGEVFVSVRSIMRGDD